MKLSGKNHISILTRLFILLIFGIIVLFQNNSKAHAQGTFNCTWVYPNSPSCVVDHSTTPCEPGGKPVDSICNRITNESDCIRKINQACEDSNPGTYYRCGTLNTCYPCDPNDGSVGCTYTDWSDCSNACKGKVPTTNYLCSSTGCSGSITCDPNTNPNCYASSISCEANCDVTDPDALGPNQYKCHSVTKTCIDTCKTGYSSKCIGTQSACTGPSTPQYCTADVGVGSTGANPVQTCDNSGSPGVLTALGCIPFESKAFTASLLGFLAGIIGAIALVVMLVGAITIMTAAGNPEAVKKGKELITGAITGLLFIIFSVALLRIVAGDIIKLPGFIQTQQNTQPPTNRR